MMERLGAPQTHLGLKGMIAEVDEDNDNKISFREFLLIFRKAGAGELEEDCGLSQLARLTEISVEEVGVNGAKTFFEAKVIILLNTHKIRELNVYLFQIEEQGKAGKFEQELRNEQEERRREEEERARRRQAFKQTASVFQ
jgi:EF-hand domain-containing family member D2